MSEAEVRRCPVCGAPVASGLPRCSYCRAPLASVHCAGCFALNTADAVHCIGCGQKLGLEPLDLASEYACPACRAPCRAFAAGAGRLSECTTCGGQFVEHALLEELLERRELFRVVTRAPAPRANPLVHPVVYLKCPVCETVMNRNNFGGTSGVVVDVCPHHGVWFDPGELPRILEFVQAGGLERARQRAAEERTERARHERLRVQSLRAPSVESPDVSELGISLSGNLGELLARIGKALSRLG
jgi:Zn-finger nucleic acid-binding protein